MESGEKMRDRALERREEQDIMPADPPGEYTMSSPSRTGESHTPRFREEAVLPAAMLRVGEERLVLVL